MDIKQKRIGEINKGGLIRPVSHEMNRNIGMQLTDGQKAMQENKRLKKRIEELEQRLKAGQHETIFMWRSVEDKMPLPYKDVLIFDGKEIITGRISERDSINGKALNVLSSNGYYHNEGATHWAPLPEPPQAT